MAGRPARDSFWPYLVVGLATSRLEAWFTWPGAPAVPVLSWGVVLAIVAWAFAALVAAFSFRRLHAAASGAIGSATMIAFVAADAVHVHLQQRHFDFASLRNTYDALRTHVIRPSKDDLILLAGGAALVVLLLALLFRFASRTNVLRRSARGRRIQRALVPWPAAIAAFAFLALFFRDLIFRADDERAAPLFWHAPLLTVRAEIDRGNEPPLQLGTGVVDAEIAALDQLSNHPESWTVTATSHPRLLFVHVESLRADMWNALNMPKTFAWRDRCTALPQHYSTGNHTSTGMFGVMTGLNGGYDLAVRLHKLPNLPLLALGKLGYERHVWSANENLDLDDVRVTLFGDETVTHAHRFEGDPVYLADTQIVDSYLQSIEPRGEAPLPRFDYLVLDSSHYDYQYPPEFAVHAPTATLNADFDRRTGEGQLKLDGAIDPATRRAVKNRYDNSVLFADAEVGKLLSRLDESGKLGSTVVVVFGDHGEAFWDRNDTFGHSSALDEPQTHVPLLVCAPKKLVTRYSISSHADVFPTVFALMGMTSSAPFMTGKSLLSYDASLDFAVVRTMLVGTASDPRMQLVTDGMKLGYYALATPLERNVTTMDDKPWSNPPADRVGRAMAATVVANVLR